jgi:hypothetical protein
LSAAKVAGGRTVRAVPAKDVSKIDAALETRAVVAG